MVESTINKQFLSLFTDSKEAKITLSVAHIDEIKDYNTIIELTDAGIYTPEEAKEKIDE